MTDDQNELSSGRMVSRLEVALKQTGPLTVNDRIYRMDPFTFYGQRRELVPGYPHPVLTGVWVPDSSRPVRETWSIAVVFVTGPKFLYPKFLRWIGPRFLKILSTVEKPEAAEIFYGIHWENQPSTEDWSQLRADFPELSRQAESLGIPMPEK
jgi:hypothetical protein